MQHSTTHDGAQYAGHPGGQALGLLLNIPSNLTEQK